MNKVTAFLPPWANNQDAKHQLKRVKSLLLRRCPRALRYRTKEPLDDELSYPTRSRKNLVCEYKHPQSMAPVGDRPQVLQTSRTCSLHAKRRLSVHAGSGRQNNSPSPQAAAGSSCDLREIAVQAGGRTDGEATVNDAKELLFGSCWVGVLS